jgi:hypothetical protein
MAERRAGEVSIAREHVGGAMQAQVGDRIIVESHQVGTPRRSGTVVEPLSGQAGDRYRVRWDDGHETILCPGSDTHIEHQARTEHVPETMQAVTQVELRFEEDVDHTDAWATLRTPGETFSGWGRARRNPVDEHVPLVGEELAAARALIALADRLRESAGVVMDRKQHPEGHLVG